MRTIKIPKCSYELYTAIRDLLMEYQPYGVINQDYSPNKQIAIFNFWDSDYIPPCLHDYVLWPPKHFEVREELSKKLVPILKNHGKYDHVESK